MGTGYVHGYSAGEETRLHDQATTLTGLLHADTRYPAGSRVLEAGCGVGAQTVILARHSPGASFTSIDISAASLAQARDRTRRAGVEGVGGQAVGQGLMDAADWAAGVSDLRRAAGPHGTFCYTFFKAVAFK